MWENVVFLVIFDTCDVVSNWSISLLPPIVLDNLFGPYSPYYVTRTSANGSAEYWSRDTDGNHVTSIFPKERIKQKINSVHNKWKDVTIRVKGF